MKFSEFEYVRISYEEMKKEYETYLSKLKETNDPEEFMKIFNELNKYRGHVDSMRTICSIRHTINTVDEFYDKENEYWDNTSPLLQVYEVELSKLLLDCPFKDKLDIPETFYKLAENSLKAFSPEIIEDLQEENKLATEYGKLKSSAKIEFDGEIYNLASIAPKMMDPDRDVRKRAVLASTKFYEDNEDKFDEIYDKLVKVRDRMAKKLGYPNFTPLGYIRMNRLDYDEKMVENYRNQVIEDIVPITVELRKRLNTIVEKYGDDRRTQLIQISNSSKEEKEIENVEPEKCVVIMTKDGAIKRVPAASFRTQRRNGKGIKNQSEIVSATIRTNTIDSLMVFTDKGKMYRILVDNIPVGTNASKGTPIKSLIVMESNENPTLIYSIYRDTDAKYLLFTTKNGLVKKTSLEEYVNTKKKTGIAAINLKENDELISVNLIKDEDIILLTSNGMGIKFNSKEVAASGRATMGIKGITLKEGDCVVSALPVRHEDDEIAIFAESGLGKKIKMKELITQKKAGKGLIVYKPTSTTGDVVSGALVSDEDSILIVGTNSSICISAKDIPSLGRASIGNQLIKNNIVSVSKV